MPEPDTVASLVERLREHNHMSQRRLQAVLVEIRRRVQAGRRGVQALVRAQGLRVLLHLLTGALPSPLLALVASIVGNCAVFSCARRHFVQLDGVKTVVRVVDVVADADVVVRGIRTLANLAKDPLICDIIHRYNGLQLSLTKILPPDATELDVSGANVALLAATVRFWRNLAQNRRQVRAIVRSRCVAVAVQCLGLSDSQLVSECLRTLSHLGRQFASHVAAQFQKFAGKMALVVGWCGVTQCSDQSPSPLSSSSCCCCCLATADCSAAPATKAPAGEDVAAAGAEATVAAVRAGFDAARAALALPLVLALCCDAAVRAELSRLGVLQLLYCAARLRPAAPAAAATSCSGDSSSSCTSTVLVNPAVLDVIDHSHVIDRDSLLSCLCMFACEPLCRLRLRSHGLLPGLVTLLRDACLPLPSAPSPPPPLLLLRCLPPPTAAGRWRAIHRRVLLALSQFVYDDKAMTMMVQRCGLLAVLTVRLEALGQANRAEMWSAASSSSESEESGCDLSVGEAEEDEEQEDEDGRRRERSPFCVHSPSYRQGCHQLSIHQQLVFDSSSDRHHHTPHLQQSSPPSPQYSATAGSVFSSSASSSPSSGVGSLSSPHQSHHQHQQQQSPPLSPTSRGSASPSPSPAAAAVVVPDDELDWVLLLLSRESQRDQPHSDLSSERLLRALTLCTRHVPAASPRAPHILCRLAQNAFCFRRLVLGGLSSCVSLHLGRERAAPVLDSLATVAKTGYGQAELHSLLKMDGQSAVASALCAAYTLRECCQLERVMSNGGLSVLTSLLVQCHASGEQHPVSTVELEGGDAAVTVSLRMAVDSWAVLLHTLCACCPLPWPVVTPTITTTAPASATATAAAAGVTAATVSAAAAASTADGGGTSATATAAAGGGGALTEPTACRYRQCTADCDVTLVAADGGAVRASRHVLAAGSGVLAALLSGAFCESQCERVPLAATVSSRCLLEALVHVVHGCSAAGAGGGGAGQWRCSVLGRLEPALWLDLLQLCDTLLLTEAADQLSDRVLLATSGSQLLQLYRRARQLQLHVPQLPGLALHQLLLARLATATSRPRRHLSRALRSLSTAAVAEDLAGIVTYLLLSSCRSSC